MASNTIHEAFENILKETLPGTLVYPVNMPLLKMDELARAETKMATFLFFLDAERRTTSGPSGVHDVLIEVNLFGKLEEIDEMAETLNDLFLSEDVKSDKPIGATGWTFCLTVKDKKDIWEPNIKAKRIWIQYKGIVIKG